MNPRDLFLIKCKEIEQSLKSQSEAEMLTLAQSLRQLLVDGDRLVDQVNRDFRVKIRFVVGFSTIEREEEIKQLGIPIPDTHFLGAFPPNEEKKEIKLEAWLRFTVVSHERVHYSVRELIKACCNRLGAVHYGEPKSDSEREAGIRRMGELLSVMGLQSAFSSLVIVATTTLHGLRTLRRKALDKQP